MRAIMQAEKREKGRVRVSKKERRTENKVSRDSAFYNMQINILHAIYLIWFAVTCFTLL